MKTRVSKTVFASRHLGIARLFFVTQQLGVLVLFWIIYPLIRWFRFEGDLSVEPYAQASFLLIAAAVLEFFTRDPETRILSGLTRQRLVSVSHRQTLFGLATIFGAMVMLKDDSLSRVFIALFFLCYFLWISWTNRFGFRLLHRALYRNGEKGNGGTVLVGEPKEISRYCSNSHAPQPPGTHIVGFIPVGPDSAAMSLDIPLLGELADLRDIVEKTKARVLVLLGLQERRDLVPPLSSLSNELGLRTMWIEDVTLIGRGFRPYHTGVFSVVSHLHEPLEDPANRAVKRLFDLTFASIASLVFLPPAILLVATLHRIFSPGPLFYRQQRSGRNGETFEILKFRSMRVEEDEKFVQARAGDPRIFKGGGFIRKTSIDELPQLLNVLRGQMSIVGPRPHPLPLDERLKKDCGTYRLRNLAKPGLTGLAQSRGWRGETRNDRQLRNRIRLDVFYIQKWSLSLDIRVIAETVVQVFRPPKSAC